MARYVVARDIYSDEKFDEEHEKVYRKRKTILSHVTDYFRPSLRYLGIMDYLSLMHRGAVKTIFGAVDRELAVTTEKC